MVNDGSFYGAVTYLIGEPQNYAGQIIIYPILAIMFLWILELILEMIFMIIRKV
jgi:hypothetical protein